MLKYSKTLLKIWTVSHNLLEFNKTDEISNWIFSELIKILFNNTQLVRTIFEIL